MTEEGQVISDVDVVLVAIGRNGNYAKLNLDKAGVQVKDVIIHISYVFLTFYL